MAGVLETVDAILFCGDVVRGLCRKAVKACVSLPLLLLLGAVSISTATEFNLDSLLTASIGGRSASDRLREVRSYRVVGTVLINDQAGRFVMEYAYPDRVYLELTIGRLSLISGHDGERAWQQDVNGSVSQLGGFEERELLKQAYFQSYSYLFTDRLPGEREYRGITSIDGRTCHLVALSPLGLDTVLVYIDTTTGLQHLSISRLDNVETRTYSVDYRLVDGILMPFGSRGVAVGAPISTEFLVDTLLLDHSFDPLLFMMPSNQAQDFNFPSGVREITIPFEFKAGHIYVTAIVNGSLRVSLLLDSGASANIFHKPAVAQLNLTVVGSIPAKGIGGFQEVQLVQTDSVQIGPLTLLNQVAGWTDLPISILEAETGVPFGGILGYDFLSRFPIMVDYANRTLTVFEPESFELPEGGQEMPFHLTMHVPTIEAELIGIKGDFLIDLGNAYGLVLHQKFVQENGLGDILGDIQPLSSAISGVGGPIKGNSAFAASFAFGEIRIHSLRVVLPESGLGLTGSEEIAGNVGNLLLERFRLLFDYTNSRIVFYDRSDDLH